MSITILQSHDKLNHTQQKKLTPNDFFKGCKLWIKFKKNWAQSNGKLAICHIGLNDCVFHLCILNHGMWSMWVCIISTVKNWFTGNFLYRLMFYVCFKTLQFFWTNSLVKMLVLQRLHSYIWYLSEHLRLVSILGNHLIKCQNLTFSCRQTDKKKLNYKYL